MPYKDPEARKQAALRSYYKHKEKNKEQRLVNATRFWELNPEKRMLSAAKGRAKAKGFDCTITVDDIIIPTHCPILGIELTTTRGHGRILKSAPALDRIDNTKGYIPGNVQVISFLANQMKYTATKEELVSFAQAILRLYT